MKTVIRWILAFGFFFGGLSMLRAASVSLELYDAGYVRGPTAQSWASVPQSNSSLWVSRPEARFSIMAFDLWSIAQNEGVSLAQLEVVSATLSLTRSGAANVSAGNTIPVVGNFNNLGWNPDTLPGGSAPNGELTYNNAPGRDLGNDYRWGRTAYGNGALGTFDANLVNVEVDVTSYLRWAVGDNPSYFDNVADYVASGLTDSEGTMLLLMLDGTVSTSGWQWNAFGFGETGAPSLHVEYVVIPEPAHFALGVLAFLALIVAVRRVRMEAGQ